MTALQTLRSPPHTPLDANGGGKRTFKDKLHGIIQEAEAAEVAALREQQLQDKKSLAISLLLEGRPAAFVDFFHLTHGTPFAPASDAAQSPAGARQPASGVPNGAMAPSGDADDPQEVLGLLKHQLVLADAAAHNDAPKEVYAAYKTLAKYFAQLGRLRKAEFFFKRCLNIATRAEWLSGELEANLALGVVYEELQDTAAAIACHSRRLELSTQHKLTEELPGAFSSLTSMFLRQAEAQEACGASGDAIQSYNRCLQAADQAGDIPTSARAHFRLGMLHFQEAKYQEAMHYLSTFIQLSPQETGDRVAEGTAHTTYAQCLMEVGDLEGATLALDNFLDCATGQEPQGPAIACCSLGILYYQQKKFERAVTYFEKFFEVARTLPDRRILDLARLNLGVARGALCMSSYMELVDKDLMALISWKNARVPFTDT